MLIEAENLVNASSSSRFLLSLVPLLLSSPSLSYGALTVMPWQRAAVVGVSVGFSRSHCRASRILSSSGKSRIRVFLGMELNRSIVKVNVTKKLKELWSLWVGICSEST